MTKLNVSNIQHFSVGDGPGIRTTLFLKGCNLRCPWCHNPETISAAPQELFFKNSNKRVQYGKYMTVEELVSELTEDKDFYGENGGVTVSGGEPLLQSESVAELLGILKNRGISTLVDTAGCVLWENFERVRGITDIFYYDYKTANEADYSAIIGGQEALVFENLCRLIANGHTLHVRIPLIPGFNTSEADSERICKRLLEAGAKNVDLLPFHRLGSSKYEALSKEYLYKNTEPQSRQEIESIAKIYEKYFIVTIEK